MSSDSVEATANAEALLERKGEIERRLQDLDGVGVVETAPAIAPASSTVMPARRTTRHTTSIDDPVESEESSKSIQSQLIPYVPKTDTHWDFVMKEMMWLGADFQGERKRQVSLARKIALSVKLFHRSKEARRLKELQLAELKRRKLAAKLSREVIKGWWSKIEKVITYKQKLQADQERQAAMNKQLVLLVQQTEKYTESLAHHETITEDDSDDDGDDSRSDDDEEEDNDKHSIGHNDVEDDSTVSNNMPSDTASESASNKGNGRQNRRAQRRRRLTIEEALAAESSLIRRSKKKRIDYSHMKIPTNELFYGESTASDASGSDGSYDPYNASDHDDSDNDSTLQRAIQEELRERNRKDCDMTAGHGPTSSTFLADPEELRKLREEVNMDVQEVIGRLQQEGKEADATYVDSIFVPGMPAVESKGKHVSFSRTVEEKLRSSESVAVSAAVKYDADDDADASDVEDYNDDDGHRSDEEFEQEEPETDDETTMAKLEALQHPQFDSEVLNSLSKKVEVSDEKLRVPFDIRHQAEGRANNDQGDSPTPNQDVSGTEHKDIDANSGEFRLPEQPEVDDERTIEAEERLGRDTPYEEEIDLLKRESEIPIEQLRAMYAKATSADVSVNDDPEDEINDDRNTSQEKQQPSLAVTVLSDVLRSTDSALEEDAEEYEFREADAVDDETTLEAEEKLGREMSYADEIALLKQESEMSIEELRAKYAPGADAASNEEDDANSSAEEFLPDVAEVDDETTLDAEERMGREMTHEDEMAMLKRESEIPVEELRALYSRMEVPGAESSDDVSVPSLDQKAKTSLSSQLLGQGSDNDEEEEFEPDENTVDDETTMEAEERLGRDMSHGEEIALLKRESEMPIEELRKMYICLQEEAATDGMDLEDAHMSQNHGSTSTRGKRGLDVEDTEAEEALKKPKHDGAEFIPDVELPTHDGIMANKALVSHDDGTAALNALEASALRAQQTLASRPFLLASWVKLRHYQQVGLNWLVSLQSRRLNGVLADEMGLGKTLQTIALLSYLASYKGIWGPHLIIVPTSVIINWETELKRFCPALKVLTYYGSAKRRKDLRQGWTKTNWYHVVITSYQLAVQDAFAFKRKKWYYLVLDEAQNIKNFQSQRWQTLINFNTQRRLLLTGTPLQNNLMELWSLLHFLMPYIFRSRKEFAYWFSNPMNNIIEGHASRNDDVVKRLHGIIRPFVLRRLKKDVETQMPGKFEHIVKCQLSRRQMTLYEEFLSRSSTRVALKKGGNFMGMMNVLMQLRKVCNHPDLFEPRSVITPFILPALSITVPSFIGCATRSPSVMAACSRRLLEPLWAGSQGLPSVVAALRHDNIEAEQLRRLCATIPLAKASDSDPTKDCPGELMSLIEEIERRRGENSKSNNAFQNSINKERCHAAASQYTERLLDALQVEISILHRAESVIIRDRNVILTPSSLLKMRLTEQERAAAMEESIDKFVFCVPSAGAKEPELHAGNQPVVAIPTTNLDEMLLEPVQELIRPYRKAQARLSSFFPDKKLIQFDAGKLQTLAELLHNLKRGGHRCLIFTQMSKMLDILEAFLNLNGHTYLRLDGTTGVDKRQRYMDRFNNDTKIFCFILSTRSGGMGVNLTGADTVIFYDSDWNPAMDAQAQDRAHRIGQTREVHIYRLITEHTIEENILLKAKQKKNLDILVMDQGKFDASHQMRASKDNEEPSGDDKIADVYTKDGLRAILGVHGDRVEDSKDFAERETRESFDVSSDQLEKAMAALEDEDDVQALRGAQKEAAEELKEFDENAEIAKESDAEQDDEEEGHDNNAIAVDPTKKPKNAKADKLPVEDANNEEAELEMEFAAWQTSIGVDATAIESSLSPMERYGLSFREKIDPFYSIFHMNELRRKSEAEENQEEIDIEEIERAKAMEERKAMDDGDLLGTRPRPEHLVRQRNLYRREKARLRSDKKRRKITGQNWTQKVDGLTKALFWYNEDSGEAIWDTPASVTALRAEESASKKGWAFLQVHILAQMMEYLVPFPERHRCALVCRQWKFAAGDYRFIRHVYPVEMGALARDPSRREANHFPTIEDALAVALPGDTIELSDGHYWVSDAGLLVEKPIKLIGDEYNPANVVLEMSGSIEWSGKGGFVEGVTFRRPKMTCGDVPSFPMLRIIGEGRVDIVQSVLDNEGSMGSVVVASGIGCKGKWHGINLRNGGCHGIELYGDGATLTLSNSTVSGSKKTGIICKDKATLSFENGTIRNNGGFGIDISGGGSSIITNSQFRENSAGPVQRESGCTLIASANTAYLAKTPKRGIPGFKMLTKGQQEKELNSTDIEETKLQ